MGEPTSREEEVRAMLALEAVGALTDEERAELEVQLRDRPDLRAELDELRAAAALLGDAASEPPPVTLRVNVLDAIAATPQEPPVAPAVPLAERRRRRTPWIVAAAAAAAAIAAVAVGVIVTRDGDGRGDQVAAVVDAPDAVTIDMPATPDGNLSGSLSIVYSTEERAAVLRGDGLEAPPDDGVYQLWAIRDGTPEPDATFRPDDGDVELYLPGLDPASAEAWAVTREPPGGSRTPTLPIVAVTAA